MINLCSWAMLSAYEELVKLYFLINERWRRRVRSFALPIPEDMRMAEMRLDLDFSPELEIKSLRGCPAQPGIDIPTSIVSVRKCRIASPYFGNGRLPGSRIVIFFHSGMDWLNAGRSVLPLMIIALCHCPLPTAHCLLPIVTVHCPIPIRFLLSTVDRPLLIVHC